MKAKYLACLLLLSAVYSCSFDELQTLSVRNTDIIYASFGDVATKAFVDADIHMHWNEGDKITTYPSRCEYVFSGTDKDGRGVFKLLTGDAGAKGDDIACYNVSVWEDTFTGTLDKNQEYREKTFSPSSLLMYASKPDADSNEYVFESLCSYLVVRLYGEGNVESVELRSNGDDFISGSYSVYGLLTPDILSVLIGGEEERGSISRIIKLRTEDAVCLGSSEEEATDFWFVVPSFTFKKGITVTVTSDQKRKISFSTESSKSFERNKVYIMDPVEVKFPSTPDIILEENQYRLKATEDELDVPLYANVEFDVRIDPSASWIEGWSYLEKENVVRFQIVPNEGETRHATVSFVSKDQTITTSVEIVQFSKNVLVDVDGDIHLSVDHLYEDVLFLTDSNLFSVSALDDDSFFSIDNGLYSVRFYVKPDHSGLKDQECRVKFTRDDGQTQIIKIILHGNQDEINKEKEELSRFYQSLGGDGWDNKTNWSSEKPLNEWYGLSTDKFGRVELVDLPNNNLIGRVPILHLDHLKRCWLHMNPGITGSLPIELADVDYTVDVSECGITGAFPDELCDVFMAGDLVIRKNHLSGNIPEKITNHPRWNEDWWASFLHYNDYVLDDVAPVYPKMIKTLDLDGKEIDFSEVVSSNKLTVFFNWYGWCLFSYALYPLMVDTYSRTHDYGLEVIGISSDMTESDEEIRSLCKSRNTPWRTTRTDFLPTFGSPAIVIVDNTGRLVFVNSWSPNYWDAPDFIETYLSQGADLYESKDYSKDGQVYKYQTAAVENGLDLVVTGDGFADVDIDKFNALAVKAVDAFFEKEPFATFRDLFNVYFVTAVSKNNRYVPGAETRFSVHFGAGTEIGGDDAEVLNYSSKAHVSESATIIVLANSTVRHGTCKMMYSGYTDYAEKYSICFGV